MRLIGLAVVVRKHPSFRKRATRIAHSGNRTVALSLLEKARMVWFYGTLGLVRGENIYLKKARARDISGLRREKRR